MAEKTMIEELRAAAFSGYPQLMEKMRMMAERYWDLPEDRLISAYLATPFPVSMWTDNPYVQNKRVKGITTKPAGFSRNEVAQMVQNPENMERELRSVERGLEYTAYPMFHIRTLYQSLLTYHSYIAPEEFTDKPKFWREWRLLEQLRKTLDPKGSGRALAGEALKQGKVFVFPRIRVDPERGVVDYAFLQYLPSDWVKIVGFNNISKYTVAFNLMYFVQPGTDWRQFGDLFAPYIDGFRDSLTERRGINLKRARENPGVDAAWQNGRWFYWVTLPVDRVFPFEIDETDTNVLPPFTGLFLDFIQLSQMEQIQLELLQNPLVSLLHGEIPYFDTRDTGTADQIKLSDAMRKMFTAIWYQMLAANNTGGIGLYAAPFLNMKLETLAEAPSALEIVSTGYQDSIAKSGLSAILPTTADARAGAVNVSLLIESQFPKPIYTCYERMMRAIIDRMNLRYHWRFSMFGDLATDEKRMEELRAEMSLGILPAVIEYNALRDRSVLEDLAWSRSIDATGLNGLRKPLKSSYTMTSGEGGRPKSDGITSEGQEQDTDDGKN